VLTMLHSSCELARRLVITASAHGSWLALVSLPLEGMHAHRPTQVLKLPRWVSPDRAPRRLAIADATAVTSPRSLRQHCKFLVRRRLLHGLQQVLVVRAHLDGQLVLLLARVSHLLLVLDLATVQTLF